MVLKKQKLSPVLCVAIFYEKFFLGFLFGSTKVDHVDSQTLFDTQARRKICSGGNRPSGGDKVFNVEAEGRRKVEDRRKVLVDEKKNTFLDALGTGLFPWPALGLILIVKEPLGAVFGVFWTSLGIAQPKLYSPLVGSWVLSNLDYGTSRRNLKFARVRLRHHNREPYLVLRNVGSFSFL